MPRDEGQILPLCNDGQIPPPRSGSTRIYTVVYLK